MKHVDVLLGGREDADMCLGVKVAGTPGAGPSTGSGHGLDYEVCEGTITKLRDEFGFRCVGLTLRQGEFADDNDVSAVYFDGSEMNRGPIVALRNMVDRVGGGDAFAAGVIHGSLQGWDGGRTVRFGVAASALAHTIHGDFNLATAEEVESVAAGGGGGRVQR